MNRTLELLVAAAIAGSSPVALAASPKAASFADTFAQMQSLSSNSSQWQPAEARSTPATFARREPLSLRDYQALSSNSSQWQLDQGTVNVDRGPTFAQSHPQGLPFAEYQALSANSDQYGSAESATAPTVATSGSAAKTAANGEMLRHRLTSWFRGIAPASTQDD